MEPSLDSFLRNNILLFLISIALFALLSFIEKTITALRLFKLKELAKGTSKYRTLFHMFEHNPNRLLIYKNYQFKVQQASHKRIF